MDLYILHNLKLDKKKIVFKSPYCTYTMYINIYIYTYIHSCLIWERCIYIYNIFSYASRKWYIIFSLNLIIKSSHVQVAVFGKEIHDQENISSGQLTFCPFFDAKFYIYVYNYIYVQLYIYKISKQTFVYFLYKNKIFSIWTAYVYRK